MTVNVNAVHLNIHRNTNIYSVEFKILKWKQFNIATGKLILDWVLFVALQNQLSYFTYQAKGQVSSLKTLDLGAFKIDGFNSYTGCPQQNYSLMFCSKTLPLKKPYIHRYILQ